MFSSIRLTHLKIATLSGVASMAAFHLLMRNFFPGTFGRMGHDYSYFLPRLLDGYFWWRQNGIFSIPWFTPSFLGGAPYFPNPQSLYHSIPQALALVMDPVSAVYVTVLLFAAAGFAGFYALLAGPFRISAAVCVLGAFIFLFNGFYIARMIVGHFSFHSFMLAPWIIFFLVRGANGRGSMALGRDSAAAGLMLAYMASSGGLALAPVMVMAILAGGSIHVAAYGGLRSFALRFTLAGVISLGLSASKIVAVMSFLSWFPGREPSPMAGEILGVVYILLSALFLPTDAKVETLLLTNRRYFVGLHELDYSISPVALILIVIGGYYLIKKLFSGGMAKSPGLAQGAAMASVLAISLIPPALIYDSPAISSLVKSLPVLKHSTGHLRWIAIYIPMGVILAAMAIEKVDFLARRKLFIVIAGVPLFIFFSMAKSWEYYLHQEFNSRPVIRAYHQARAGEAPFKVSHLGILAEKDGELITRPHSGVAVMFAEGISPIWSYDPIFGYKQRKLGDGGLVPGPVMEQTDGLLNLRNPACFVYPQENGCPPGGRFTTTQRAEAELFRSYRPFEFHTPQRQKIANAISLAFIPLALLALLAPWMALLAPWMARRGHEGADEASDRSP